jgi:hypothetical protein
MMASPKLPSTALYLFFSQSIYDLYDFMSEKQLRLAYETFNCAIQNTQSRPGFLPGDQHKSFVGIGIPACDHMRF